MLSFGRMSLAPVFYVLFHWFGWTGHGFTVSWVLLVLVFLVSEFSDIVDGHIARKMNQVSILGKVLDPFSDVVAHSTYFFCLVEAGFLPGWMFLLFLFRELGIILIRMVLLSEGTALAARAGGKIKSLLYAFASGAGILLLGAITIGIQAFYSDAIRVLFLILIGAGLAMSWFSFGQYFAGFLKRTKA